MYSQCPLCNQFETTKVTCPICFNNMYDFGKVSDYFDDYSAYLDSDGLKKIDGYKENLEQQQCPHYFSCPTCHKNEVFLIDEWVT